MKAVVKYKEGKGLVELRDVAVPSAGPGEVRIKVEYAGICASDLHILNDDIAITIRPPVVMGHAGSGRKPWFPLPGGSMTGRMRSASMKRRRS